MSRVLRSAAVAAVAMMVLSACGSDGGSDAASDASDDAPAGDTTSLTIVVTPAEGAETSTYELTCDPAGGDHPQPQQACDAVAQAGADIFDPVPADQSCTQVYGGPQVATVTGTYEGKDVDATFSRDDGCEIDRWEQLGTTFFDVPLL
ncbi:MAG: SSI family serine proteinase inhibitor [Aeromicrobium sp.]